MSRCWQVEGCKGEKKKEEEPEEVQGEENAIEMADDFEGALQDIDPEGESTLSQCWGALRVSQPSFSVGGL